MDFIIEAIKACFRFIKNIFRVIIQGILKFRDHIVSWFKNIRNLNPNKHTPFIADAKRFRDMLKTAPTKNVGIFEGVYDEEQDEIVANRYLDADSVDQETLNVLSNEPLVVLS